MFHAAGMTAFVTGVCAVFVTSIAAFDQPAAVPTGAKTTVVQPSAASTGKKTAVVQISDEASHADDTRAGQSPNWAQILARTIPSVVTGVVTIIIVLTGFRRTVLELRESTQKSIQGYDKTIAMQQAIAERQIKAEVLTKSRQEWIKTLRDEIATYISLLSGKLTLRELLRVEEAEVASLRDHGSDVAGRSSAEERLSRLAQDYRAKCLELRTNIGENPTAAEPC